MHKPRPNAQPTLEFERDDRTTLRLGCCRIARLGCCRIARLSARPSCCDAAALRPLGKAPTARTAHQKT